MATTRLTVPPPAPGPDPLDTRKPLVLLEAQTSLQIIAARMVRPAERLAAMAAAEPVPERCFRRLLQQGERLEAARFLAAALHPAAAAAACARRRR
ncbi:MAG: hypothetical protein L6R48_22670, partial [Planctomycetes bacterium]|nr:hypothetical protein [Planctomycetota bacterium]